MNLQVLLNVGETFQVGVITVIQSRGFFLFLMKLEFIISSVSKHVK